MGLRARSIYIWVKEETVALIISSSIRTVIGYTESLLITSVAHTSDVWIVCDNTNEQTKLFAHLRFRKELKKEVRSLILAEEVLMVSKILSPVSRKAYNRYRRISHQHPLSTDPTPNWLDRKQTATPILSYIPENPLFLGSHAYTTSGSLHPH